MGILFSRFTQQQKSFIESFDIKLRKSTLECEDSRAITEKITRELNLQLPDDWVDVAVRKINDRVPPRKLDPSSDVQVISSQGEEVISSSEVDVNPPPGVEINPSPKVEEDPSRESDHILSCFKDLISQLQYVVMQVLSKGWLKLPLVLSC